MVRRLRVWVVIAAMVGLVIPMSAGAQLPSEGETLLQALLGEIEVLANENGANASELLKGTLRLRFSDGSDPLEVTVEEFLVRIAGQSVVDTNSNHGILGTPQANAGNILHVLINATVETWTSANGFPFGIARTALPPAPAVQGYNVAESGLTPSTPVLAVPNPLLLTGTAVPPELPQTLNEPILVLHAGGRLKSVQASNYLVGFHSAGTTVIGSNTDTEARATTEDDPWPIWLPVLTSSLSRPDSQFDFLGFAIVGQGQSCTTVPSSGSRVFARICTLIGTVIGDGASLFDGGPVDLRETTSAVAGWQPAPATPNPLVGLVDDVLGQVEVPELPSVPTVPSTSSSRSSGGLRLPLRR